VTVLLDAHTLLWFLKNDPQLSGQAKSTIENAANRKLISVASCWEIAIKAGLGKLKLGEPVLHLLTREIADNNFELLPISLVHAASVESLPPHHRDPFDRLLVIQSLAEGIPIVSVDKALDAYGIARIW
jgi:PIN domain nuclease of toxin-antitoxin system